jgi:hypothetical protein
MTPKTKRATAPTKIARVFSVLPVLSRKDVGVGAGGADNVMVFGED